MKVLFLANYMPDHQHSMLGFANAMERGLAGKLEWVTVRPEPKYGGEGKSKWLGYIDKYAIFPRKLRKAAKTADLIHILDHSNAVYVPHVQNKPHLVTCHDLLPQRAVRGEFGDWRIGRSGRALQTWIAKGLKQAKCLACVSEATKQDAKRLLGIPDDRLTVVLNGLYKPMERIPSPEARELLGSKVRDRFLLHVGGNQPYKNRAGVVRQFANLANSLPSCPILVLAGSVPTHPLQTLIASLGLTDSVVILPGMTDKQIEALYSLAEALLFFSTAEGFGLPVLEAMACGCPVITSNRAPMTEVGGDVPLYVDPVAPGTSAEAICEWWPHRWQATGKGISRAALFTTESMVSSYRELYAQLRHNA